MGYHGIPWEVPWDPRGVTMGAPWVGSLSLLGLKGSLGLVDPWASLDPRASWHPREPRGQGPWRGCGALGSPANSRWARAGREREGKGKIIQDRLRTVIVCATFTCQLSLAHPHAKHRLRTHLCCRRDLLLSIKPGAVPLCVVAIYFCR